MVVCREAMICTVTARNDMERFRRSSPSIIADDGQVLRARRAAATAPSDTKHRDNLPRSCFRHCMQSQRTRAVHKTLRHRDSSGTCRAGACQPSATSPIPGGQTQSLVVCIRDTQLVEPRHATPSATTCAAMPTIRLSFTATVTLPDGTSMLATQSRTAASACASGA